MDLLLSYNFMFYLRPTFVTKENFQMVIKDVFLTNNLKEINPFIEAVRKCHFTN